MRKIYIINGHHQYPFSPGKLNVTLVDQAHRILSAKGYETKGCHVDDGWDVEAEIQNHQWADTIIVQSPVNWMGVTWKFKQYMDEVYSAGMGGELCNGDGRTKQAPKRGYGTGGTLNGKTYMLSLTFNAPKEAFNDPDEYLFQGRSVDDLWFPMHMNFRFFNMTSLPTFVCYDVMKNPEIAGDLDRFEKHLDMHF